MSLIVDTNSWISVADATTYFATRYGAGDQWGTSIPSETNKEAALITAYNQIQSCKLFEIGTVTQDVKNAQCEQALFIIIHQTDSDSRMGVQAQGVLAAGIVKETYKASSGGEIPISPIAKRMLETAGAFTGRKLAYVMDIDRDEDEDADANVND